MVDSYIYTLTHATYILSAYILSILRTNTILSIKNKKKYVKKSEKDLTY